MPAATAQASEDSGGQECPPLLTKWQDRIKAALDDHKKRCKEFEKNREYSKGTQHDDGKPGLVRTNLIYANQATIVPHTYAKNPEIAISPSKAVGSRSYRAAKDFAGTMEIVLQRMFVLDTQLKKRMRGAIYSVYNTGEAWLKMIYQRDHATDPVIKNRIHDAQDNLARLEKLIAETANKGDGKDIDRQRDELKVMIEGLQSQVEVAVAEGLVIDRVLTDDMLILDKTVVDFEMYIQAEALDHLIWMSKDEYAERFSGWPEQNAPTIYHERKLAQDGARFTQSLNKVELVCVHELWHLRSNTVLTFADGAQQYAREPYSPSRQPERWYPFYRLGWNHLDASADALPDVSLQRELQDEYNSSRTQFSDARQEAMPVRVVRGSGSLTQTDVDNIKNRKSRQIIVVEGKPGEPLNNDLGQIDGIRVDPNVYDTTPIRGDMEMVAGRGDASTGGVVQAKTATEAEIMQAGLMSRSDYRRDIVEDAIQEMATAAAEMLLQELTIPQVEFIAGEGAVWPMLAKPEVFALINIDIRAGSTAKPNMQREREQWNELLPLMQDTIGKIFELQSAGQQQMADVLRKLMKETLRRYDERLDLDEYLGPEDEEGQGPQRQVMQLQQQAMQLQQALEQAQQQIAQFDAEKQRGEQIAADTRARDLELKQQEMAERREERAAAREEAARRAAEAEVKRTMEGAIRIQTTREQMDREDARAEMGRQWEREKSGLEQQVQHLQAVIDQIQSGIDPNAEQVAQLTDMRESIMTEIKRVEAEVAEAETNRQQRTAIIAEYLKGPRTDDALRATVNRLTGAGP